MSTGSLFPLTLEGMFRQCARAGFDGLELVADGDNPARMAERANRFTRVYHLPVRTVHQNLLFKRTKNIWCAWMLEAADLALRVEARHVVIHNPSAFRWESPAAQRWLRTLDMMQRRLQRSGVRIALENSNPHNPDDRYRLLAQLPDLSAFAREHDLDLTYDTCHAAAAGVDILEGWRTVSSQVVNIHLSDYIPRPVPNGSALLRSLYSDHQLPGRGILPLDVFRRQLLAENYRGAVTFELSPLALPTLSTPRLQHKLSSLAEFGKS
ncbi:MAG: sugar phosphate isomerase/epimerase [Chloroflexi bacterium]|nr:sugar phosphate isomerase/epimerase [Chloroflexota bacterium]